MVSVHGLALMVGQMDLTDWNEIWQMKQNLSDLVGPLWSCISCRESEVGGVQGRVGQECARIQVQGWAWSHAQGLGWDLGPGTGPGPGSWDWARSWAICDKVASPLGLSCIVCLCECTCIFPDRFWADGFDALGVVSSDCFFRQWAAHLVGPFGRTIWQTIWQDHLADHLAAHLVGPFGRTIWQTIWQPIWQDHCKQYSLQKILKNILSQRWAKLSQKFVWRISALRIGLDWIDWWIDWLVDWWTD